LQGFAPQTLTLNRISNSVESNGWSEILTRRHEVFNRRVKGTCSETGEPQEENAVSNTPSSSLKVRKRRAGPEDVEIGRKIRALRLERGLSQSALAEGIGLTFQQVQKYEKGTNRVSAGRLQQIANLLNTPITFFYRSTKSGSKKTGAHDGGLALLQTKGALRLLRSYGAISSRATKYALVVLAESLSNQQRS
jgi:transcriptional regulator with XRE-family HTH domain